MHSEKWSVINFTSCISITCSDSAALHFFIFLFISRWKSRDNCDFILCIAKYFSGSWWVLGALCGGREGKKKGEGKSFAGRRRVEVIHFFWESSYFFTVKDRRRRINHSLKTNRLCWFITLETSSYTEMKILIHGLEWVFNAIANSNN